MIGLSASATFDYISYQEYMEWLREVGFREIAIDFGEEEGIIAAR